MQLREGWRETVLGLLQMRPYLEYSRFYWEGVKAHMGKEVHA